MSRRALSRGAARALGTKAPSFKPQLADVNTSRLAAFSDKLIGCAGPRGYDRRHYERLHARSVSEPRQFWRAVFDAVRLPGSLGPRERDARGAVPWRDSGPPGAVDWFPDAAVNHAELLLEGPHKPDENLALLSYTERSAAPVETTYGALREEVGRLRAGLAADGVGPGDRVAGVVANDAGAAAAMLAATSLGAAWSSVSPDFGERGCLDRLAQVEPKVLFVSDAYSYRGREFDVVDKISNFTGIGDALKTTARAVVLPYGFAGDAAMDSSIKLPFPAVAARDYGAPGAPCLYDRGGFDRPAYVMFSSGTTGKPKCIVQGPGVALNHAKEGALHWDLRESDRSLWYTTTGWMMWNWLLGAALTTGGAAVLYDGDATFCPARGKGTTSYLWDVAESSHSVLLGGSARYLGACAAEDVTLPTLEKLKRVGSTGSPCPPSAYAWLAREKPGVGLHSTSGGTDLNGSFHGGNPWLPVFEAELQSAGLGLDVAVLDEAGDGEVAAGEQGELACRSAFPCAPLAFLGDDGEGSKYRAAYFDDAFGGGRAWRHGDWVEPTAHGGLIIHGRSDATLNPGGVRIGTAEIYNAIEPLLDASPDFSDALVSAQPFVARDGDTEIDDVRVVLFVQVADAAARDALTAAAAAGDADALVELCRCDDAFAKALKTTIRERGSPRHVPAIVCRVPDVPRTNNGKKVEMACMNLLRGRPVANRGSIANAGVVDFYEALAPHLEKLLPQGGR